MNKHECQECRHFFGREDIVSTEDGMICRGCYDEWYILCDGCQEAVHKKDVFKVDGQVLCETCYDKVAEMPI